MTPVPGNQAPHALPEPCKAIRHAALLDFALCFHHHIDLEGPGEYCWPWRPPDSPRPSA
jgi:hypothetical protein